MGASSGIGYAVAEALASRGVKVGLAARHTKNLLELKEKYPDFVEYLSIDVTHNDAPAKLFKLAEMTGGMDIYFHVAGIGCDNTDLKLAEMTGGMDIYFHVAGIGCDNTDLDPAREVEIVNTNASGFARMVSSAYRYFCENGKKGHIAAVTSVAGTKGIGNLSAYSASKKFDQTYLVALEQLAHMENMDIKFTDIRPGWVRTPLIDEDKKYPMEMTVEEVLPMVIKAIVRRKRVAIIDGRWNALAKVWSRIPDNVWVKMNPEASMGK